jgi:hypothetical protein
MSEKAHLTLEGVAKIQAISASINSGRAKTGVYQPEHTKPSSSSYVPLIQTTLVVLLQEMLLLPHS